MTANVAYEPPYGQFGRVAAKLIRQAPEMMAVKDLKRFKMLMEAGEIATAKINPTADNAA